eukprot:Nk52_evm21s241 gene=Nk52_evmTU21s241
MKQLEAEGNLGAPRLLELETLLKEKSDKLRELSGLFETNLQKDREDSAEHCMLKGETIKSGFLKSPKKTFQTPDISVMKNKDGRQIYTLDEFHQNFIDLFSEIYRETEEEKSQTVEEISSKIADLHDWQK